MVFFNDCDVVVNNTGILAESASLNVENSIAPIYTVGQKGIIGQYPQGPLKTTFQFNYIVEVSSEPNHNVLSQIKSLLNDIYYSGINLEIGGVIGQNCYLESYSLKAVPNDVLKANVSYVTFYPVFGDVKNKTPGVSYDVSNTLGHGWSAFITSTGGYLQIPTYEFSYEFRAAWEPIYSIGNKYPVQVKLIQGDERMTITRDSFYNINFSGDSTCKNLLMCSFDDSTIQMAGLSVICNNQQTGFVAAFPTSLSTFSGIIVDNPGAIYSGKWLVSTSSNEQYGDYYTYSPTSSGQNTAAVTYQPNILQSGLYNVYTTYVDGFSRSSQTPISINYSGGMLNLTLDQTTGGGSWTLIATGLPFGTGFGGNAILQNNTNQSGKIVVADAFLWTNAYNSYILSGVPEPDENSVMKSFPSCDTLNFPVSGSKLKSSQINAAIDDIVRTVTTITNSF